MSVTDQGSARLIRTHVVNIANAGRVGRVRGHVYRNVHTPSLPHPMSTRAQCVGLAVRLTTVDSARGQRTAMCQQYSYTGSECLQYKHFLQTQVANS